MYGPITSQTNTALNSNSPQYVVGSPPYDPRTPSMTPPSTNSSLSTTTSQIPPPPPGSPPSSPGTNVSLNNDYVPGTPIMITPMVPTQKLSEADTGEALNETNTESSQPKKGVSYSTVLNSDEFKRETPLLTTIEENKEKEKEEKLKSVNL